MRITWGWAPTHGLDPASPDHADLPAVRRTRRSTDTTTHPRSHLREGTTRHV